MKKTVVLAILDGWGIGAKDNSNPIHIAVTPNYDHIRANYRGGALQSAGIAVGLPWGEEGNSEVGHLTIGAGKVIYQHYPRISLAIKSGEFFKNEALLGAISHAKKNKSAVHLVGLLSEGNVHASLEHLSALIKLASQEKAPALYLHLFSDGKDSPPKSVKNLMDKVEGEVVSFSGRYYAMDRDEHWDRTAQAYAALVGEAPRVDSLENAIAAHYQKNLSDEYIEPVVIGEPRPIKDNHAVIFFNFREDSMRQIAAAFSLPDFKHFAVKPLKNLYLTTMTNYSDSFKAAVAFPPESIDNPLGKVLADNKKTQLRIAETEKYAHVTFFFNGLRDQPFANEYRVLIPSKNVPRHDEYPPMMARELTDRAVGAIQEGGFDFILINFANPDIIAHTGNFDAAIEAIQTVDKMLGRLLAAALARNAVLVITSDHGNAERMRDPLTGAPESKHDPSPVPLYIVGRGFEAAKDDRAIDSTERKIAGLLADVTPTILELLEINKPAEMTGESLVKILR